MAVAVDREARLRAAGTLRAYLEERMGAFALQDRMEEVAHLTDDPLVFGAQLDLWHFYDDFIDHPVHASREVWNYFHRLLLLLETELPIEEGAWLFRFGLCPSRFARGPESWNLAPFATLTEVMRARRAAPHFVRIPYRPELGTREIRPEIRYWSDTGSEFLGVIRALPRWIAALWSRGR